MKKYKEILMEVVELEEETIHLLVKAERPGLENHWWVVDTGASKSVIDRAVASFFVGEESEGSMATGLGKEMVETSMGVISDFRLDGIDFGSLKVAIVDLHHINDEYSKYSDKRIAGLLGSDFFYRENATIDYKSRTIKLD
ncbi:MAG: retropepsin-like aspartic protease [Prolixibacteraceae bacterium]